VLSSHAEGNEQKGGSSPLKSDMALWLREWRKRDMPKKSIENGATANKSRSMCLHEDNKVTM
jgi:hypothetical protein